MLARIGPAMFVGGVILAVFSGMFLLAGFIRRNRRPAYPRGPLLVVLFVAIGLLVVGGFGIADHQRSLQPVVQRLAWEPVGVNENVLVVNIRTDVRGTAVELRAGLSGPRLSAGVEAQLDLLEGNKPAALARPGVAAGNNPWTLQPPGAREWQIGFVFPDATAAGQTFRQLQAREVGAVPLDAGPPQEIFHTIASDGQEYVGRLEVGRPVSSGHTNWVFASGQSTHNESVVNLTWDVQASQPAAVRLQREGSLATAQLQFDPKTKFHHLPIHLELTKVGTNRVLLVRQMGGVTSREEFTGSFREISAELLRTVTFSAKTVRGAGLELCQVQGKPFTVQLSDAASPPAGPSAPTSVTARLGFGVTWLVILLGLVVLFFLGAGAVVLVLLRKGQTARNIGAVLLGVLLLLLFVGLLLGSGSVWYFRRNQSLEREARAAVAAQQQAKNAALQAAAAPAALDEIDGRWRVVSVRDRKGEAGGDAEYQFQGGKLTISGAGRPPQPSVFLLRPFARPKEIDLTDASTDGLESTTLGIYRLDQGRLILATDRTFPTRRPKGYNTGPSSGIEVITLERVP